MSEDDRLEALHQAHRAELAEKHVELVNRLSEFERDTNSRMDAHLRWGGLIGVLGFVALAAALYFQVMDEVGRPAIKALVARNLGTAVHDLEERIDWIDSREHVQSLADRAIARDEMDALEELAEIVEGETPMRLVAQAALSRVNAHMLLSGAIFEDEVKSRRGSVSGMQNPELVERSQDRGRTAWDRIAAMDELSRRTDFEAEEFAHVLVATIIDDSSVMAGYYACDWLYDRFPGIPAGQAGMCRREDVQSWHAERWPEYKAATVPE